MWARLIMISKDNVIIYYNQEMFNLVVEESTDNLRIK